MRHFIRLSSPNFCFLLSAFCFLLSAFCFLLSAFCFPLSSSAFLALPLKAFQFNIMGKSMQRTNQQHPSCD
ncbi:MAG: hypothetical protein CVV06_10560 [Gammaproteobacteria bacterium HGW-Gammaproteobacteria-10]|nr:MAG: hypothetical protein CVV06_10560 [Gammaproteobacteria bacterium HGW-Gammaproteobacteria-10]